MPRSRALAVCALLVAVVAGCGDDDNDTTPTVSSSVPGSTDEPGTAPSSTVSETTTTVEFPTTSLPCSTLPTPKTPVTSPPGTAFDVYLTKVERIGDACVDHVLFSFAGNNTNSPGYEITYGSPPFSEDGSGTAVPVAGSAFVVVKLSPAYGYDFEQNKPTFTGPKRFTPTGANHVREVVHAGEHEGVITWVIGLDAKRPFSVQATATPRQQLAVTIS
jgi:hypothetical protein